jgi:hypothetical protein
MINNINFCLYHIFLPIDHNCFFNSTLFYHNTPIRPTVHIDKIPPTYPLGGLTLKLIDKVTNLVVETQVSSAFPKSPR